MNDDCPACKQPITAIKENFNCPHCKVAIQSNRQKILSYSLRLAFIVWVLFLVAIRYYTGSWGYAVLLSLELGWIVSAVIAYFYYRVFYRLKIVNN